MISSRKQTESEFRIMQVAFEHTQLHKNKGQLGDKPLSPIPTTKTQLTAGATKVNAVRHWIHSRGAFAFGAKADASRLAKQIPGDSAKSQKQITLSGGEIF